ncbi:efflux transporter outer membrane subunit [Azoarcus sp. L1K30]|uniref:efflux transporter outer membrane subunit n=1 Tax=Azoarcus sp. L1K30 TaxID=2820277 RepID=UPI001B841B3F|nr:efflux transporter outer membrane subunit [Azoarcus sp. L1K30]MBR0567090.1 efflux transporter outer membrane subunit [Azoarcus sp. L1K30]
MTTQTTPRATTLRIPLLLAALLTVAGCALTPAYERPAMSIPPAFKEAAPARDAAPSDEARWKTAMPAEAAHRGEWWTVFGDATLNALESDALAANQDLKAAAARLAQARALGGSARAERLPQIDAGLGPTRQRPSPASQGLDADASTTTSTLWRAQASIGYEVDLFGRVAATVDAADAGAQHSEALLRSVQLALQADVASTYFLLRELDAEQALFRATVDLRSDALKLVLHRFEAGDIGELDVARGRTELASAQSEAHGIARRRAAAEHALAILLGKPPAEFSFTPQPLERLAIEVPAGLPSELLERRPDIAAAEREMAAANARIGIARAAFFPRLNLTGALGYESGELGDLLQWSSRSFLLGPLAGTVLSLPIFDGGRRQAELDRSRAAWDEDVARYRQTVLSAFREVEDSLSAVRILGDQARAQNAAVMAAERAAQLSQLQYREGATSYFEVIDADRSVLQQRRLAVQLDGERARSTVALIRALGGGWDASPGQGDG